MNLVIALGGNAILLRGERGTAEEQFAHVRAAAEQIADLIALGHAVVITHGNGPQVGDILLKNECAKEILPRMPLDVCGAQSQGMIGYMLQQCLENALAVRGIRRPVISLVTQTLVDPADPAFRRPTKPIGPFYTAAEAEELRRREGWAIRETGTGEARFRRVVPSPDPIAIVEQPSIGTLAREGFVVIAAGGGGIPVYRTQTGALAGIEAVVDKDLAAERLAAGTGAEMLLILTDVPQVYRDFGTPAQAPLAALPADEARALLEAGQFAEGSMEPKIRACIRFVGAGGREAVITSLGLAADGVAGRAGTRILP